MIKVLVFIIMALSTAFAEEPLSAIEWLDNSKSVIPEKKEINNLELESTKKKVLPIIKTKLDPINLNGIGIIPSYVANLKYNLWVDTSETTIATRIESLKKSKFSKARTLLKRILIIESDPPLSDNSEGATTNTFLLSRIDKLIEIGALDEAETLLFKIEPLNRMAFSRFKKVAFLTGRLDKLCQILEERPKLTNDISARIICLSRLGDWNASAIILSSASALNALSPEREELLMFYLDPDLFEDKTVARGQNMLDPITFYVGELNGFKRKIDKLPPPYLYNDVNNKHAPLRRKITAAESLVRSIGINGSRLFNMYRSNKAAGSGGLWERMILIQRLDEALQQNEPIAIQRAVVAATSAMAKADLLIPFSDEYGSRLKNLTISEKNEIFNETITKIFSLRGEIPRHWFSYVPQSQKLSMAVSLIKGDKIESLNYNFYDQTNKILPALLEEILLNQKINVIKNSDADSSQGLIILKALELVSNGIETDPVDLQRSLKMLVRAGQNEFAKSLVVEFLIRSMRPTPEEYHAS